MEAIKFNFSTKRTSTSFSFGDLKPSPVTITKAYPGKKHPDRQYIGLEIDGRPYMIEQGDLNETKGFELVCEPKAKAKGELVLVAGARISSLNGVISWSVAA